VNSFALFIQSLLLSHTNTSLHNMPRRMFEPEMEKLAADQRKLFDCHFYNL